MAYDGSKLSQLKGTYDGTWNLWLYRHTDAIATVNTAGYFADATARGMKVDDMVIVVDTTNHLTDFCIVAGITSGAGDITDGLRVTSTNSD